MDNKGFDPMSIFWLFLIISSLQPLLKQKMIEAARTRLIAQIERKRNSRVILIVHRQEAMSFLGIPLVKYLTMEDSEEVLRAIELTDSEKDIDLVLHTPGGLVIAALQIARAIQNRKGKTRVIVPHYAMSGGTLIALASDEIIMSPNAVLGPVDPQLGEYPGPSLKKLMETKPVEKIDDKTFIMADIAEKAIHQMQESLKEILSKNYSVEKSEELSKKLTEGVWTHDFPITYKLAKELGLRVTNDIPQEYMELMSLYSQPMRKQKNVEYLHYDNHHLKS